MNLKMKLLPPSPVTSPVPVDVRLALDSALPVEFRVEAAGEVAVVPGCASGEWQTARVRLDFRDRPGRHQVKVRALDRQGRVLAEIATELEVLNSPTRSSGLIDGAWAGLYHWSEAEGRLWNPELARFTEADWKRLVRDMHGVGMDIIVLQELFRNEEYYGRHDMARSGYKGKAFYPSRLHPGRMDNLACADPVEAVMAAADELGMAVLPGVGMYAWFDFTPDSLEWHKQAAAEIWERYGHHRSFYGWYISEEVFGNLHYGENTGRDIVEFFRGFRTWKDHFDPTLPVMLAPNCFDLPPAEPAWRELARELDILCPFAFHRMEPGDLSAPEAIALFQDIADSGGAHLWLDMEAFLFTADMALYPRPFEQLIAELGNFTGFEKILCYQYPGLMNAPEAARKPGGAATVELYSRYQAYYRKRIQELTLQPINQEEG